MVTALFYLERWRFDRRWFAQRFKVPGSKSEKEWHGVGFLTYWENLNTVDQ